MTTLIIVCTVVIIAAVAAAVIAENYVEKLADKDDELDGHRAYDDVYRRAGLALIPVKVHRQDVHGHWH